MREVSRGRGGGVHIPRMRQHSKFTLSVQKVRESKDERDTIIRLRQILDIVTA